MYSLEAWVGFNLLPLLPDKDEHKFSSYLLLKCTMAGVHKSSSWTQSGAFAGVVSAEPCHLVLETSPPDYVKKISRYLESSVGRDEVSNEIAGADRWGCEPLTCPNDDTAPWEVLQFDLCTCVCSDSGDSLFLTQKQVPEAVRSGKREHLSLRSKPVSPRDLEGSDAGSLSSDSHEEPKTAKDERYKKQPSISSLPKFSLPFLSGRKLKGKARDTRLSNMQNKTLHVRISSASVQTFCRLLLYNFDKCYVSIFFFFLSTEFCDGRLLQMSHRGLWTRTWCAVVFTDSGRGGARHILVVWVSLFFGLRVGTTAANVTLPR